MISPAEVFIGVLSSCIDESIVCPCSNYDDLLLSNRTVLDFLSAFPFHPVFGPINVILLL